MNSAIVDNQGRLTLPPQAARELGSRPLAVVSRSDRHLLLAATEEGSEVTLAGRLGELSIADLLSFFNMFRKTGVLRFELSGGSKDLYFQQGEIVFATSTFPEEEIGEILHGMGKLSREIVQKIRPFITGRISMDKLLVERGAVTAKDLWLATRQQAEAIVFHLFAFQEGSFSFLNKEIVKEEVLRLSMNTQNLIMEGLRRVDERALFMRRLGSLDAIPVATGKTAGGIGGAEQRLLEIVCEDRYSLREAVRRSGLEEFDGLRVLYQLLEKGLINIEEAPATAVGGVLGEILTVFNGTLTILFRRISRQKSEFPAGSPVLPARPPPTLFLCFSRSPAAG